MKRRAFRLASLLRVRRAQEDQAAAELARAAAERLQASQRAERQRRQLAEHRTPEAATSNEWMASVAARAALSAASRQADAVVTDADDRVSQATAVWQQARRDERTLERLEQRHDEQVAAEQARREQLTIDEHAVRRHSRGDQS
jgi:flagellar FliJ protein